MKQLAFLFVVVSLLVQVACTNSDKPSKNFPEKDVVAALFADLYKAESVLEYSKGHVNKPNFVYSKYYKDVLDKYELTQVQFDVIVSWYTAHPKQYILIYDDVISILSQQESELGQQILKDKKEDATLNQIKRENRKNIWNDSLSYHVSSFDLVDSINYQLPYHVEIDSVIGAVYKLRGTYQFFHEDELSNAQMNMVATYSDFSTDTARVEILKSFLATTYRLELLSDSSKQVVSLSGLMFAHDTTKVANVKIKSIKLTREVKLE